MKIMSNKELSEDLSLLFVERLQKEGKTYREAVEVLLMVLFLILDFVAEQNHIDAKDLKRNLFNAAIEDLEKGLL